MTCNIHIIQVLEIRSFLNGVIGYFYFKPLTEVLETKKSLEKAKHKCIKALLKSIGIELNQTSTSYNYHYLNDYPELALSVSHTANYGVIALAKRENHESIGVDIEIKEREINALTSKYFVNEDESPNNLLEFWTKKEAAFKACSPVNPQCKLLKDLKIRDGHYYLKTSSPIIGEVQSFNYSIEGKDFIISIATNYLR
jgi:phosphopantetheinyl transferase (holo-ACP synthase)